jgi:hypothetical protein
MQIRVLIPAEEAIVAVESGLREKAECFTREERRCDMEGKSHKSMGKRQKGQQRSVNVRVVFPRRIENGLHKIFSSTRAKLCNSFRNEN